VRDDDLGGDGAESHVTYANGGDGGDGAASPHVNDDDDDDHLYDACGPCARSPWSENGASPAREYVFFV
jgi:hypothetical protein